MIELSADCINNIAFPLSMDMLGNYYLLKAIVRCTSGHFTIAIKEGIHWLYVDDLCTTVNYDNILFKIC